MFSDSDHFDPDDFFKDHNHFPIPPHLHRLPTMEIVLTVVFGVGILVIILLICRCCCSKRDQGRVIATPSAHPPAPPGPALYPQQQYTTVTVPTVTVLPVGHSVNTSYPTTLPYPTGGAPYTAGGATYPTAAAPYPTGGAQYPTVGTSYPTGGAPYPTGGAPYPTAMPLPNEPPSAPDPHAFIGISAPGWNTQALPPSYEQVMSAGEHKQPPYNPYTSH